MPLYLGTNEISEKINTGDVYMENTFDLFDTKWSDHIINNASWLRSDTFDWIDGTIFTAAWNELKNEWDLATTDSTPSQSDEINGVTINYWRTPKGYKIVEYGGETPETNETLLQQLYDETGIAWYYLIDTTGKQRFKLPRTKYHFEGIRSSAGNFIPETLPNITGKAAFDMGNDATKNTGAIYAATRTEADGDYWVFPGQNAGDFYTFGFNASLSSKTYQDDANVQEKSTEMYLYFYVMDSIRSPLYDNLNNIISDINTNLNNKTETSTFEEKTTELEENLTQLTNTTTEQLNLKANIESPALTGTPTCPTPTTSDNSTNIINSEWFNTKIQVVTALPETPDPNVFYFITE